MVNDLKTTQVEVGLILAFGSKPEFKRKVFANLRKSKFRETPFSSAQIRLIRGIRFPFEYQA